jgi:outer membrane immunogenic protein
MVVGTVGALALTASANAADLYRGPAGGLKDEPYVSVDSWTGYYVGVNGGYAWSADNDQFARPGSTCSVLSTNCPAVYPAFGGLNPEGGFGGGQVGYNLQGAFHTPWLVIGVEADIQGADISDSATVSVPKSSFDSKLDWFGTARGRIGYATDRALFYFTGGAAIGDLQKSADFRPSGGSLYTFDGTVGGYVLGGGIEYKITPAWSLKAEYQYLNFGQNVPANSSGVELASNFKRVDDAYHTVRLGLNYHFVSGYEPLK